MVQYNATNVENIHRPFLRILSNDAIYKALEQAPLPFCFPFSQYALMYFTRSKHTRQTDSELFNFSPHAPAAPLLNLPTADARDALEAEKLVMMYMRDLPIAGNPSSLLDRLQQYLQKNVNLCDECYCFLMKQITANMLQASEKRGWELLTYLLTVKLPSYNLYPYVVYYICRALLANDVQVGRGSRTEG